MEQDLRNFSSSSHRMTTVSAADALQISDEADSIYVSTGLAALDEALEVGRGSSYSKIPHGRGGLRKGHVTEIYGPPGVGKTALALEEILFGSQTQHQWKSPASGILSTSTEFEIKQGFEHFVTPTTAHLFALIGHYSPGFPPADTDLLVIDGLSALLSASFPRSSELQAQVNKQMVPKSGETSQWIASRKWTVMGDLISKLNKLAAAQKLAVCILSQTSSKVRIGSGAILYPAIGFKAWDSCCSSRIALFRDWPSPDMSVHTIGASSTCARYAAVTKCGGVTLGRSDGPIAFVINKAGLEPLQTSGGSLNQRSLPIMSSAPSKRKREVIEDSDAEELLASDDEFGLDSDDDLQELGISEPDAPAG
ncbi:hypothetical protein MMC25_001923 [Agyrium rufum]|nr:hypothetical protein [Agyrium rufum]